MSVRLIGKECREVPYNFVPCDRELLLLLPPSLLNWLPREHPALFVIDAVGEMDLSRFYAKRRQDG